MFATARSQIRVLARDPILLVLVLIIFACIALFVVYPLIRVLIASLQDRDGWTLANYALFGERRLYRNALVNSLGVASLVAVFSVVLNYREIIALGDPAPVAVAVAVQDSETFTYDENHAIVLDLAE